MFIGLVLAAKMDAENGVLSGANGQSGGGSASSDGVHDEILTVCKAQSAARLRGLYLVVVFIFFVCFRRFVHMIRRASVACLV